MDETAAEPAQLQDLIDAGFARSGPHLLSIMSPQCRLSATETVAYLQGVKHLAVGTVTAAGAPRV